MILFFLQLVESLKDKEHLKQVPMPGCRDIYQNVKGLHDNDDADNPKAIVTPRFFSENSRAALSWLSHTSTNTTFFPKPPTTFLTCFRDERRIYAGKNVCLNQV